jgi:hypothetical protein
METNGKLIGKARDMYVTDVFKSVGKVSLSKNIDDACNLDESDCLFVRRELDAVILQVTTTYKEIL